MKRVPLKRTGGLKRKPRKRYDPERAAQFFTDVCTRPSQRHRTVVLCVACGQRKARDAHHILPKQFIYEACRTARVDPDDYLWDVRNGLPLCRQCHVLAPPEGRGFTRQVIPLATWNFIATIDHLLGTLAATEKICALYPVRL